MPFDPQKLFLGIMDLFTILMPGALLTFLLRDHVGEPVLGARYHDLSGSEAWALFLLTSYLVGHVVFLVGASLDEPYDWLRRRSLGAQTELLGRTNRLMPRPVRALAWLVFRNEENVAVSRATALRRQMLAPLGASSAINTFQWSKAWLTIEHPAGMSTVQRFEADSKFFRSFSVVVAVLIVVVVWRGADVLWPRWSIIVLLLLLGGSLWRFMELRLKSTNQAYWFVLTVAAGKGIEVAAPTSTDTASHAGGVVIREHGGVVQCVLVGSTDDPEQLVLPKGKIRPGEDARVAATREVREEAGQWARIDHELGVVTYDVGDDEVTVRVYLMDSLGRTRATDSFRRVEWIPIQDAIDRGSIGRGHRDAGRERALHPQTITMLRAAATARGIALEEP